MQRSNVFFHEKPNWPDFTWRAEDLIGLNAEVNREAGVLAGRLSAIGFDDQLRTAAETIAADIVASSSIEGIALNTDEVRSSVARKLGIHVANERASTHYVDGIVEMMLDATVNYSRPVDADRLFEWHSALFPTGRSGMAKINVAMYRTDEMSVVSGSFGREKLHYRAPAPDRVPQEMDTFIAWINREEPSYIKSAIAHLWFVSIHPFDDGNGRIARALSDMILAHNETAGRRFYSVSAEISREKSSYYEVLERTQRGNGDITEWLAWYLRCIRNAIRASNALLSGVLRKSMFWNTHSHTPLTVRQTHTLNTYLDGYDAKLTLKNYARLNGVSVDTAARDIRDMVEKGVLRPDKGKVRNVAYSLIFPDINHSLTDITFTPEGRRGVISASTPDGRRIAEQIADIDITRLEQGEVTLDDLADKYFSFIKF